MGHFSDISQRSTQGGTGSPFQTSKGLGRLKRGPRPSRVPLLRAHRPMKAALSKVATDFLAYFGARVETTRSSCIASATAALGAAVPPLKEKADECKEIVDKFEEATEIHEKFKSELLRMVTGKVGSKMVKAWNTFKQEMNRFISILETLGEPTYDLSTVDGWGEEDETAPARDNKLCKVKVAFCKDKLDLECSQDVARIELLLASLGGMQAVFTSVPGATKKVILEQRRVLCQGGPQPVLVDRAGAAGQAGHAAEGRGRLAQGGR